MVMGWPQPQPEAVQSALDWLRAQDPRLSLDVLAGQLRAAGYGNLEVEAAIRARQAELDAALPPGTDLRRRAATVLIVAFFGTWLVITVATLVRAVSNDMYSAQWIYAGILAFMLLIILVPTLALVGRSGRLRRGSYGALAAVLAIPFVLLVIVAGTCVAFTNPFMVEPGM
jgi:hypothetical protein